jgi:hypothetical protein
MIAADQTFKGATIFIDGGAFARCKFEGCILVFSGLIPAHLEGCYFNNCKWEFAGPAANTFGFLATLYAAGARELVEKTFDNIRKSSASARHPGERVVLN